MLHRVRLIEDHEIILEKNPFVIRLAYPAEQREEKRVVQNHHV